MAPQPILSPRHDEMSSLLEAVSGQFLGAIVMTLLSGCVLMQQAHYFRSFPHDGWGMQIFVHLACIISHVQTGMIIFSEYYVFVKYFGNMQGLMRYDGLLTSQYILTGAVTCIVQVFYARRMWALQGRPFWVLVFFGMTIPLGFLLAIAGTVAAEMFPSFAAWYLINWGEVSAWEHNYQPILLSGWALTLFINVVIFLGTWFTLRRFKHDADERCRTVLCKMIRVLAETMFLPVFIVAMTLVFGIKDGTAISTTSRAFQFCQSKVFIMSLLHLLISRTTLREKMNVPFTVKIPVPLGLGRKRSNDPEKRAGSSTDSLTGSGYKHKMHCNSKTGTCDCCDEKRMLTRQASSPTPKLEIGTSTWHAPLEWADRSPLTEDYEIRRHCSLEQLPAAPPRALMAHDSDIITLPADDILFARDQTAQPLVHVHTVVEIS